MIRDGRLNFTQIAARLGFQSVHYFSRRFRKVTGMSPSEYAGASKCSRSCPAFLRTIVQTMCRIVYFLSLRQLLQ